MSNEQRKAVPSAASAVVTIILAVVLMVAGIFNLATYFGQMAELKQGADVPVFDLYSESDELQGLEFMYISDAFAEYTYGTAQGFYLVFDEEMYGYIICMEQDRLTEEFQANYDYTYTDIQTVPENGYVEGYAVAIDEEIREYAMEYFNVFWDEELCNETNFEDYLGSYYLDTTVTPNVENNRLSYGVVMLIVALLLLIVGISRIRNRAKVLKEQEAWEKQQAQMAGQAAYEGFYSDTTSSEETASEAVHSGNVDVEVQGNIVVALVASALCACVGGVLWVLIYKLGYIAGITGCVAAAAAVFGYEKIGKRKLTTGARIWCIAISLVVLLLGNAVAYAWDFTEYMSAGSLGRAQIGVVLSQLPSILSEYEMIGSFFGDWGMGVFFAALGGFSIGNRKK